MPTRVGSSCGHGLHLFAACLVAGGLTMAACSTAGAPAASTSAPAASTSAPVSPTTTPAAATYLTPFGVAARWVVAENDRPGTTDWRIPPGTASDISGYASTTYAARGSSVRLYVSTRAPSFRVDAYRMGWYHGAGARLVWSSPAVAGGVQPACTLRPVVNMVACDSWHVSLEILISAAFVQGDYLFKLVGSDGSESYVPLTVWDPSSRATYLVKNDVFTWQAWNPYGGYDFYAGLGACPPDVYPPCSRARVVSFDRPYGYGEGAGDFLGSEYPFVRFAEQHGLDVTYVTDVTVEQHPWVLLRHRALLSLGHDECWALHERRAALAAEARGVNMVFFGASAILRHVRLQASPLGADREEVDYRDSAEDPLDGRANPLEVTGNEWGSPPADWPATGFVGEQYVGYLVPGAAPLPFVVADPGAFLFSGTGLGLGDKVPGVVATDFDMFDPADHPTNLEILGHSPVPLTRAVSEVGDTLGYADADTTYWSDPASGAGIFDSGTTNWIPALAPCSDEAAHSCPARSVGRMTGNLLALFGRGPAGRFVPSVANWQTVYGKTG